MKRDLKKLKVNRIIIKKIRKKSNKKISKTFFQEGYGFHKVRRAVRVIRKTEYLTVPNDYPHKSITVSDKKFKELARVHKVNSTLLSSFGQSKTNTINF